MNRFDPTKERALQTRVQLRCNEAARACVAAYEDAKKIEGMIGGDLVVQDLLAAFELIERANRRARALGSTAALRPGL